jgi:chemotaxis response regulator CheB
MIQDEPTSVVWGMPGAVFEAKAFDIMHSLKQCGEIFRTMASATI